MKRGRLVVIEGIDGSGKTTQIELLKKTLASQSPVPYGMGQSLAWEAISFPRYEDNVYGKLVKRYLEGEFGKLGEIDPYFLALAFAGDRFLAKSLIESWLSEEKLVLINRYVSASKAHLGANLPEEKRAEFFKWLEELEYTTLEMPKEDLTILLVADPKVAQKNIINKHSPDIHEESLKHLEEASKIYSQLSENENWEAINCGEGEEMRDKDKINKEIIKKIKLV